MKRSQPRDQWWKKLSDGKFHQTNTRSEPVPQTVSNQPKPYADLVTDAVVSQAQAEQDFFQSQLQSGLDILKGDKPVDTAADLANAELARQAFPDLAPELVEQTPDPLSHDPLSPDPLQPFPGPMDPKPGG